MNRKDMICYIRHFALCLGVRNFEAPHMECGRFDL